MAVEISKNSDKNVNDGHLKFGMFEFLEASDCTIACF